ncbi:MAG: hypothetical protein LUC94_07605, partial [Clostridiales bacterium]|nr:hypothetical protein [Clostridiales bacterium]
DVDVPFWNHPPAAAEPEIGVKIKEGGVIALLFIDGQAMLLMVQSFLIPKRQPFPAASDKKMPTHQMKV